MGLLVPFADTTTLSMITAAIIEQLFKPLHVADIAVLWILHLVLNYKLLKVPSFVSGRSWDKAINYWEDTEPVTPAA